MWIGLRKDSLKLAFRVLALFYLPWQKADAQNVKFQNSSRWPIYFINSVDQTKLSWFFNEVMIYE